ncbi:hypothetical protein [Phenylobacterium sp.]|uniref:hypothetical protein n=1 Tax=Phenylobacterium sp. TaxID=1871053 RepID=UPI002F9284E5
MLRILLVAASAAALVACSTTVKEAPSGAGPAAAAAVRNLAIRNVSGSTTAANVTPEIVAALTEAIRSQLGGGVAGGQPADVTFVISDYRVVSKATRFMVGALAGSNRLTVDVTVKSPSGATLRQFTVTRSANTMGVGAVMNQKGSLIAQTAEGVAKTVRGEK